MTPTETKPKPASGSQSASPAKDEGETTPNVSTSGGALSEPQGEPDLNNLSAFDERSIHERMVAVIAELPALGKDQRNTQQDFMFRGHDQILNALNPLLAKHGIVITPRVIERVTAHRTTGNNKTMYEVNLLVEFTFWGSKGDWIVAATWGEGTDMGDKGTNKAMTMAFKNVLNQAFAISSEEFKDADGETQQQTTSSAAAAAAEAQKQAQEAGKKQARRDRITELCVKLDTKTQSDKGTWLTLVASESQRVFGVAFTELEIAELEDVGKTLKAIFDGEGTQVPEQLNLTIPF